ncbi:hypothetical protein [Achromobacter xylosoxidans]
MDPLTAYVEVQRSFLETIGELGWPGAILLIFWMLRGELRKLLARIKSAKYRDFDIGFSEGLGGALDLASRAKTVQAEEIAPSQDSSVVKQAPDVRSMIKPNRRVTNAWDNLYVLLRELYLQTAASESEPRETPVLFARLRRAGKLTEIDVDLATRLWDLRNHAIESADDVTEFAAAEYERLSLEFRNRLSHELT